MKNVVIIDSVRTAVGKLGGSLSNVPVDFLASAVLKEVVKRSEIPEEQIDEVIFGQAKQSADSANLARLALLRAGLPVEVPGYTVHRQCGSGVQSINNAALQIMTGQSEIIIAGGAESMSTAPYYIRNVRYGLGAGNGGIIDPNTESQPRSQPIEIYGNLTMGYTAENLAEKYNISREEQDEFALRSQILTSEAIKSGRFSKEIVPYEVKHKKEVKVFKEDEHPRLTSLEKLSNLKPVFKENGTVTAGNSSGRNDGASAVLVMSEERSNKTWRKNRRLKLLPKLLQGLTHDIWELAQFPAMLKALRMARSSN